MTPSTGEVPAFVDAAYQTRSERTLGVFQSTQIGGFLLQKKVWMKRFRRIRLLPLILTLEERSCRFRT